MRSLPPTAVDALTPLRTAIASRAVATARAREDEAARQGRTLWDEAQSEAAAITHRAVEAGTKAALSDAAQRSARERRRAHEVRLAGRESLRRDLERRVLDMTARLREDPEYPRMLEALRAEARAVLGDGAVIDEHPDGGVVASLGPRRLDLSLPSLATATLESMSGEVAELWMG